MYELFITNKNYSSWSLRPWVLMRQLGLAFREQFVQYPGDDAFEAFRKVSPSGRVPCLRDGDTIVWDSLAITEYLAERHPGVWPGDPVARAWARCAAAEMHAGFGMLRERCTMTCGLRVRLRDMPALLRRDIARLNELWNQGLLRFGGPFLAGPSFTGADAFYAPVAFRVQTYGLPLDETGAAYVARLLALPAMRSWYADALAEPYRDPSHEAEAEVAGTWLEDLRAHAQAVTS
ncbi:MAG TPA: glutathione S-transferase family protein [Kofleriaceae bacterium]|nr:glutathione S-transferase family protein [Kofleriaceae bacterium]